jgi:site-specific DNA-methyltransferase (adenine-specific)
LYNQAKDTAMPKPITKNTLFYGDNLPILQEYIADETIDLVYLDPPFNSSRNYNVLFKDESGNEAESQITAFEDTWHWGEDAEETYHGLINNASPDVCNMISALRYFIGANQMMAYLTMMTARLIELHRVLKQTGSIYLHCDPTASHYLKIVMDTIFGFERFQNEIIWKRSYGHGDSRRSMGRSHDIILYYAKSDEFTLNRFFHEHNPEYIKSFFIYPPHFLYLVKIELIF